MAGVLEYLPQAEQIRDATAAGENTATRVGGCIVGVITECNTSFQALAAAIAALPGAPWDGYIWDQDSEAGNQTITLTSGGTPVGSLLIKCATQSASGLMSAADKQKLDAFDDSAVAGNLIYQQSGENVNVVLMAADGVTQLAVVTLPNQATANDSEATGTGLLTAQQKNWGDLSAGCLVVYVAGGLSNYVNVMSISRVYAGQVLKFDVFSANDDPGSELSVIVKDTNGMDIWNVFGDATPGTSLTIDVDSLMASVGASHSMRIGGLQFDSSNDEVMVRCSLVDKSTGGVATFNVSRGATYVQLSGKDAGGAVITSARIEAASTYNAGVMTSADKSKLQALPTADELNTAIKDKCSADDAVGSIGNGQSASAQGMRVEYGRASVGYMGNFLLPLATTSANGVMSAADKTKLDGVANGAEKNIINEVQVDGTALSPDANGAVNVQVKPLLGGSFPNTTPPRDAQNLYLPADGTNYYLGNVSGLGLSWQTPAAKEGITMRFTASSTFTIVVPYNDGDAPDVEHEIANETALVCSQGAKYLLVIVAACGAGGAPVNIVSLNELNTPQ